MKLDELILLVKQGESENFKNMDTKRKISRVSLELLLKIRIDTPSFQ